MRRWPRIALTAATLLGALAPVTQAAPRPAVVPAANRLFVVSDSVGLGAIPQMKAAFGPAWQVTVTGKPGLFTESLVKYVAAAPAGAFGESAVVATGYNYPYWDSARFDASVDQMIAALKARGVQRIYWVTLREVKPAYYSHWAGLTAEYRSLYLAYPRANQQLRNATNRHPGLSVVDWAAISDRNGITYDAIHLNPTGAALYAGLMKATVVSGRTRQPAESVLTVPVAGARGVPTDAAAVSMKVTVVNPRNEGSVSVYPCDLVGVARPITIWFRPAQTVVGGTLVPLGPAGTVCIVSSTATHVRADVDGWFPAGSGVAATPPRLVADGRRDAVVAAGAVTKVHVGASPGAPAAPFTAVVGVTEATTTPAEVRVFTCGTAVPTPALRSFEPNVAQSAPQFVRTDANGDVCVRSTAPSRFALSLLAAFEPSSGVRPGTPRRLLDTRTGAPLAANTTRAIAVPVGTGAWFGLTLVGPAASGSAALFPCTGGSASSPWVYVSPNRAQTNGGFAGIDASKRVCVRSTVATHLTVDTAGWTGGAYVPVAPIRVLSTLP